MVEVELIKVLLLSTCGTVYLWYMKICLHLIELIETAQQLLGLMYCSHGGLYP